MAEVDTSSYKLPVEPSILQNAQQWGALEQQKIGIDQSKLKLMNEHFQLANQEMSTIADDTTITPEKVKAKLDNFAKTIQMPKDVYDHMMLEFSGAKTPEQIQQVAKNALTRGMDTQQRINKTYGVPGFVSNGQQTTPVNVRTGQGPVPSGAPIQIQQPPDTPVVGPGGTQSLGPQAPRLPAGAAQVPGGLPGQSRLPVAPNAPITPAGPMQSQTPLFEEGKKFFTEDQALATNKLTAIKPAASALKLMDGLRSGPGTKEWNGVVAFLKANNLIATEKENDPTAVYQEVRKLMSQYLKVSGSRSDMDLANLEAGTPNVGVQINPALVKLTRDQIGRDRVEAARSSAFEGNDYSKYGAHRASFPQSIDERAFTMDMLPKDESKKLYKTMLEKAKKGDAEGIKFIRSLSVADKQGY